MIKVSKHCEILYSSIKGIGDQVDITSYENITFQSPSLQDPDLRTKAGVSMGYSILGSLRNDSSPTLISKNETANKIKDNISLTLGTMLVRGIKDIIKYFSLVWLVGALG